MSNLKKCIFSIITVFIMFCLFVSTVVEAASLNEIKNGSNVGVATSISYGTLTSRNDLYCVQHNASLKNGAHTYYVKKYIEINGNTATDPSTNASVTNNLNGILAYIISKDGGYGVENGYSASQIGIYATINNWYANVGSSLGINWPARGNNSAPNSLYREGEAYANSIGNTTTAIEAKDNTNRDNLKVDAYTYSDGVSYIRVGPFNWTFSGTFDEIRLQGDGGQNLYINNTSKNNLWISRYEGNNEVWINPNQMVSGENFYLTVRADSGIRTIENITATGTQVADGIINAKLWFLASSTSQNLLLVDHETQNIPQNFTVTMENIPITKDLTVIKVDQDNHQIVLSNVGFIFYNQELGQYLMQRNGQYEYTSNRDQASEFITNRQGKITLEGILPGTYVAYETKNPNEGYVVKDEGITIPINADTFTIENRQEYIKLSGYVWEDIQSGKQSIRNDYYRNDEGDDADARMQGITVRLMRNGQVVINPETGREQITQTNSNGEYQFENVEIDNLSQYYVEFTYDGLTYQNVIPHLDADNGSKAVESQRRQFNDRFAYVERGNAENEVAVKDASGNTQVTVEYELKELDGDNGREASIINKTNCDITADTQTAGYRIEYVRGSGVKEITNINLGLYKRAQADLALQNELDQVKVEIEGYGHIYKYGPTYNTSDPNEVEQAWNNLGVRFENPYKNVYKRPIYKADAAYESEDPSKELKVALTYKITLANQTTLTSKVNSIVDYFDSRYTVVGVGTGISQTDGSIENPLQYTESEYNGTYKKLEINTNTLLTSTPSGTTADRMTQSSVYVQFDLSRENILELLNEASIYGNDENRLEEAGKNLKNVAEIKSYTSYEDSEGTTLYAAVDTDSIPENATPEETNTYEDDTDKASSLAIVIANAREISGTVFEDIQDQNLSETQNISQGNGIYDVETENTIGGVKVELVKVDANGNITDEVAKVFDEQVVNDDGSLGAWTDANVETVTDSNGNYTISGFIPGKYALKYTWGDGTYKIVDGVQGDTYDSMVENYKSTVIDYDRATTEEKNNKFYRDVNSSETRTSHALDNTEIRKTVDEPLKNYNYEYNLNKEQNGTTLEMTSTTPIMEFNIEYDDNDLMSIDLNKVEDRMVFKIDKMDFGIIRRPMQNISLEKSIESARLTLANGQVLVDVQIDENGELVGEANHTSYMKPTKVDGITVDNGYLRIEMDESLIQGATISVTFKLTVENISQADYLDETYGYYKYGESYYQKLVGEDRKAQDVITLTPSKIVDYLDSNSVYQPDDPINVQYEWEQATIEDLINEKLVATNVTDALQSGEYTTGTDDNGNIIIEELKESQLFKTSYLDDTKLKPVFMQGDTLNPAETGEVYMAVGKTLNSSDDSNFQNQAEIVLVSKPGGGKVTTTPGNYIPNEQKTETDDSTSEEIMIVPSTGINKEFIIPITIGIVAFIVLGVGVILIRKKVLGTNK